MRELKVDTTGYFCNPNIHPFLEFKKRLRAVQVLSEIERFPMVYDETYGLEEFQPNGFGGDGVGLEAGHRQRADEVAGFDDARFLLGSADGKARADDVECGFPEKFVIGRQRCGPRFADAPGIGTPHGGKRNSRYNR